MLESLHFYWITNLPFIEFNINLRVTLLVYYLQGTSDSRLYAMCITTFNH